MYFTPANDASSNDQWLDDLKKNIIDANLQQPDITQASGSSGLDILNDAIEDDNHAFSMDDVVADSFPSSLDIWSDDVWSDDVWDVSPDILIDASLETASTSDTHTDHVDAAILNPNGWWDAADLSKMTIEEKEDSWSSSSGFSFDDEEEVKKSSLMDKIQKVLHFNINSRSLMWYVVGSVISFVAILASFYFYYAERYVYYSTQPADALDETAKTILERVDLYRNIFVMLGLASDVASSSYTSVFPETDADMLQNLLWDTSKWYVEKYDHFYSYLQLLNRRIPELYQTVLQLREELVSYPFFPDLLQNIIDPDNDSSLQRSLLSLEGVKFRTAIAVFSKFDTFVRQFAVATWRDEEDVRAFLDLIMSRGDIDIDYYLSTCYLNPYENPDTCSLYGDFSRIYDFYEWGVDVIDTALFAQMMWFIDDKLENSLIANLSLSTPDFDPISQQLTLVIDVNTVPDDALQLLNQGILNPHIYVVGNMINFLRQSKFIVSEDINISELQINQVIVPVWSRDITVSTSNFEFTLPLQKNTQREITDYFVVNEADNRRSGTNQSMNNSSTFVDDTVIDTDIPLLEWFITNEEWSFTGSSIDNSFINIDDVSSSVGTWWDNAIENIN